MAELNLKRILLDMLPSPAMMAQGRVLRIPNHLEMIRHSLWAINAVILDAELRALKEPNLEEWVMEVGAATEDVEGLLGRILDWQSRAAALSDCLSRFSLDIPMGFRHAILVELKDIARRLNYLVRRGSALGLRKEMMDSMDPLQDDYYTILREEVVGRDKDRDNIIQILQTQQSSNDHDDVLCINVIRGKDGRTTLARMIYHDPWVRQHFQHRIWVDASKFGFFDSTMIARELGRWITGEACADDVRLPNSVRLGRNRCFLILDGLILLQEERNKWDELKHILFCMVGQGSTVIVTMDSERFNTDIMGFVESYHMKGLPEDAWVELFMRQAMIRPDHQEGENTLLAFAKRSYKKYYSFASIAKMLGSIFRCTEVSRWQEQIDALSTVEELMKNQHFALMLLHYIPSISGRLSLHKSLFREGGRFDDEDLLHMLTAEGFLPYLSDKEVTMKYLEKHFRWISVSTDVVKQCYFATTVRQYSRIPRQSRHLCLLVDSDASISPRALSDVNELRTLVVHRNKGAKDQKCQIATIPEGTFANLTYLLILHLRATGILQMPKTVGRLHKLRYLNLSENEIETLPKSLCNLGNLQILNLGHCEKLQRLPGRIHKLKKLQILKLAHCIKLQVLPKSFDKLVNLLELDLECCCRLVELPEDLSNMKKLRVLNVLGCASLTGMPHGMGQLTDLQKLTGYIAIDDGLGSYAIPEMQALTNLKELCLENLERVSNPEDARTLRLQEKQKLKFLALHWKWWNMDAGAVSEPLLQSVLEGFQPNIALRNLEITSYAGKKLSSWMMDRETYINYLVEIKLVNLRNCQSFPPLGKLPNLMNIEISGMDMISVIDDTFYDVGGTFPSLKKLTLSEMPKLEKWLKVASEEILFPCLTELTLIQCPKFKALEVRLPLWFQWLNIWLNNEMLLTSELKDWDNLSALYRELNIVGCQELRCLPQGMRKLKHVKCLTIISCCNKLAYLPDWLEDFRYLHSLCIYGCAELSSIPVGLKRRPNLHIRVEGCPMLQL